MCARVSSPRYTHPPLSILPLIASIPRSCVAWNFHAAPLPSHLCSAPTHKVSRRACHACFSASTRRARSGWRRRDEQEDRGRALPRSVPPALGFSPALCSTCAPRPLRPPRCYARSLTRPPRYSIPPLMRARATPRRHAPAFACDPHPPARVPSIPHPSPLAHARPLPSSFDPSTQWAPAFIFTCNRHLRLHVSSSPACKNDLSAPPLVDPSFALPSSRLIAETSHSTPRTLDLSFVNRPALPSLTGWRKSKSKRNGNGNGNGEMG